MPVSETDAKAYEGKIWELWHYKSLRYNLFVLVFCWMACSFGFYMLNFVLKYLQGSIFFNAYASSVAEIVGKLSTIIVLHYTSLKRTFFISFTLALFGTILLILFSQKSAWIPVMLLIAKLGFSQAFVAAYLSIILIYPTILASTAMGICNLLARVSSVMTPIVAEIEAPINLVILVSIAGVALTASQCLRVSDQQSNRTTKE